jgi:prepilin-type N-terminal cleavage/methylation domain-containing protein
VHSRLVRRVGFSLTEIVVAMAILGLITLLLAGLFGNTLRLTAREGAIVELEQTCHFLMEKINAEIQQSGVAGLSFLNPKDGAQALAINPLLDVTSEGRVTWQNRQLIYAWNPNGMTLQKFSNSEPSSSLSQPTVFTSAELEELILKSQARAATIATGVTFFQVKNERSDGSSRIVDVTIELTRNVPQNGNRVCRAHETIALRN